LITGGTTPYAKPLPAMQKSISVSLTTSVAKDWKALAMTTEKLITKGLILSAAKKQFASNRGAIKNICWIIDRLVVADRNGIFNLFDSNG
jgi:hypothetical protein